MWAPALKTYLRAAIRHDAGMFCACRQVWDAEKTTYQGSPAVRLTYTSRSGEQVRRCCGLLRCPTSLSHSYSCAARGLRVITLPHLFDGMSQEAAGDNGI